MYPSDIHELVSYLGDSTARVIVLSKTYDFTGSEGTTTATGCAPWGTGSGCQLAINQNNWCTNDQPSAAKVSVTYDKAGVEGITVNSHKTIIGTGTNGVIKGKGLKITGVSNVIVQNIKITDLNPKYVWGGDAVTINNADMIWIDHVLVRNSSNATFIPPFLTSPRPPKSAANTSSSALAPLTV